MQLKDSLVKNVLKLHSIMDEVFLLKGIKMKSGCFYFINDQYFVDFECKELPLNKSTKEENLHDRPCFYAIKGSEENIYWMIPISSKIENLKDCMTIKLKIWQMWYYNFWYR